MRSICGMRQSCLSNSSFVFSVRPSKNDVINIYSFGAIRVAAEHTEARKRGSSNAYIIPVISFVKSYLAANAGKYPKSSLVMQETGGSLYAVKKILKDIKSGNLDITGRDTIANCQKANADKVVFNEFVSHEGNGKEPEHSELPIFSETGRSNQDDASSAVLNADENSAPKVVPDPICKEQENTGSLVSCEAGVIKKGDVRTAVKEREQMLVTDCKPSSREEDSREDGHVKCSLQNTKNMLLTDDNLEVLEAVVVQQTTPHQKTAGSRRVNLSTVMENDMSWEKTLSSISPDLKAGQCKVNAEKLNAQFQYCMTLTSTHTKSVLNSLSKAQVRDSYQKCGDIVKIFISRSNSRPQIFVYFKTEQALNEALMVKPSFLKGEEVEIGRISPKDETKLVFDGVSKALAGATTRAPNLERSVIGSTNITTEGMADMFSSILSTLGSDFAKESSLLRNLNRVQNTVSIEKCPASLSLDPLKDFFSLYGEVLNCFSVARQGGEQTRYIEFKNEEVKNKALEIPMFAIDGYSFEIRNDEFPGTLVVRLENINSKTSLQEVMHICQNFGEVQNAMERSANVIDVQFGPGEKDKIGEILGRLAEVTVDSQTWQAKLLCHGFRRSYDVQNTCEVCLQRQKDNLKLLNLAKQLLVHLEDMCVRDRTI